MDKEKMKLFIKEYGAREVLKNFHEALKECADDYSDLGLRERAQEAASLADALDYLHDAMEP